MSLRGSFSEGKVKFWVTELRLILRKVALSIGMRLGRQGRAGLVRMTPGVAAPWGPL